MKTELLNRLRTELPYLVQLTVAKPRKRTAWIEPEQSKVVLLISNGDVVFAVWNKGKEMRPGDLEHIRQIAVPRGSIHLPSQRDDWYGHVYSWPIGGTNVR